MPWKADVDGEGWAFVHNEGDIICHDDPNHRAGCAGTMARFRLIATAPELLDAVRNFLGLFDNPVYRRRLAGDALYVEAVEHARAAIARAEGRS